MGISRNVREAYRWLATHYTDGDQLFLVGFSRGAYTVRSLAGMIRNVGLLRPEHLDRVDEAYAIYRKTGRRWRPDGSASLAFLRRYSRDVPQIECLAVWDTVGALGVPTRGPVGALTRWRYGFHDVELSGRVRNAFQALAIDERRRAFAPSVWLADEADADRQRVEQVWFAGDHSDVGGGNGDCVLTDHALRWMADRLTECGLHLDERVLPQHDVLAAAPHVDVKDSFRSVFVLQGAHVRPFCCAPVTDPRGQRLRTGEDVHATAISRHHAGRQPGGKRYEPEYLLAHLAGHRHQPSTSAPMLRRAARIAAAPVRARRSLSHPSR
jgi:hypothetical protein